MMKNWDGISDTLPSVLQQFFGDGDPIRIVDLSGVPNEVAGAASSVIARMLFSVKLWQTVEERMASPVLLVCEEAHRYVPNKGEAQYEAAQEAIKRLAKEGRKYGIGLMLVSQRPSEVEATVLSQCNSWLVMRITNDSDRNQVQGILPDSLAGLTKVLSGLRRREAIFAGQAAILPSRILITDLVKAGKALPRSQDINFDDGWQNDPMTVEALASVGKRWRLQMREAPAQD
jgi:DNA helicase HerA-like ATPase